MEPEKQENSKEVIDLVIARLESMPSNFAVSIGSSGSSDDERKGSYTIKELVKRVREQDEIGKKMVEIQLNYIRSLGQAPVAR